MKDNDKIFLTAIMILAFDVINRIRLKGYADEVSVEDLYRDFKP